MAQVAVEIRVIGRVQGVGFRWFACQAANSFDIRGWVRNEIDGSVLLRARGEASDMAQFRMKLEEGPRFGRVDQLSEMPIDPGELAAYSGFQTTY